VFANRSAEIRRVQGRIDEIAKNRESAAKVKSGEKKYDTGGRFEVSENADISRIQIRFPGKPDEAARQTLRSNGFVWSPSQGAWQRQLNNNGRYAVKRVTEKLK
jgi:hypothetical protein